MGRHELIRRYALFLFSVLVNAFSIALISRGMLGMSPISSVPYVLSLFGPLTMGQFTIIMNFTFIAMELLLMERKEIAAKKYELLSQIPVSIFFGSFIDVSLGALWWLEPASFVPQLLTLLAGCFFLAFGISLAVKADVSMVTGEYLVRVISKFIKCEFGWVKLGFDVSLVLISCSMSLAFLPRIEGIGVGTLAAALMVGPVTHFLKPHLNFLDKWLCAGVPAEPPSARGGLPAVVTITHEFGSSGRLIGRMAAERLGIKFYDKKLISMVAGESRLPEKFISENEQSKGPASLLDIILRDYAAPMDGGLSREDSLFVSQSRVIRRIARESPCVIIGRCGDYILKDWPEESIVRVFCYSDIESACRRAVREYHMPPESAAEELSKINRSRISHYQHYTGRKWADPCNYSLMINTGRMTPEAACELIVRLYAEKAAAAGGANAADAS